MKHKAIKSTCDMNPTLTSFERFAAFLSERNKLTTQSYFNALKIEFNKKSRSVGANQEVIN